MSIRTQTPEWQRLSNAEWPHVVSFRETSFRLAFDASTFIDLTCRRAILPSAEANLFEVRLAVVCKSDILSYFTTTNWNHSRCDEFATRAEKSITRIRHRADYWRGIIRSVRHAAPKIPGRLWAVHRRDLSNGYRLRLPWAQASTIASHPRIDGLYHPLNNILHFMLEMILAPLSSGRSPSFVVV